MRKKICPYPWPCCKPGLIKPLRPHCSWTLWCYSGVPRMSNLLKISSDIENDLEMAFSAHCTMIWKLNRISSTSMSKVAIKCIWCCGCDQWCAMAPRCARRWGKIVQRGIKVWSRWLRRAVLPMHMSPQQWVWQLFLSVTSHHWTQNSVLHGVYILHKCWKPYLCTCTNANEYTHH